MKKGTASYNAVPFYFYNDKITVKYQYNSFNVCEKIV